MAIGDNNNNNLFGTNNNFLEDTNLTAAEKRARFLGEDISPKQPKAVTMADASNPAFEGMSAPEIIKAVNTPGYESPSFSIPGITDEPRSKGMQAVDSLIGLQTKAMDVPLNILKTAALPIVTAGKYLFGTENSLNPTLAEAKASASESIPKGSISDLINPEARIDKMASRQDQLVKEFLANESNVNPSEILPPEIVTGKH